MKIHLIASDSVGVRSLSLFVEGKPSIFVDPSAALGPYRYGLPPKPVEIQTLATVKNRIREFAEKTDIFVISHYHYDHYDPNEDFYKGKLVLAKHWKDKINYSQKKRAFAFHEKFNEVCTIKYVDGKTYNFGDISLEFSEPVPHGNEGTKLGFVIMTTIDDGKNRILHASDVEGPIVEKSAEYIISQNPDIAIIDGPATYFLGYRFSKSDLERSVKNLLKIAEAVPEVILDHHLLRDLKFRDRLKEVYEYENVKTFAEHNGESNRMLEAHRREL